MAADFISEFKNNVRHFTVDPDYVDYPHVMYPDVLPLLAYIDQLDRNGGLTSAVSDKLRSLIKEISNG